jgi:hypothetical protein
MPPKGVLTYNFFAPLRTTDKDTETTGAEKSLTEQEVPRKPRRPPPIMTSTTDLIQLQSDLKDHVKGPYVFRNTQNGTHIVTKEMADDSAMKSYLKTNNLHYSTFSPNCEEPVKAVIRYLPTDTPAEDVFNNLEDLGFSVINVRQMTATRTGPNGQTHIEPLPLFLVTLTRNIKSQEIFNLNSVNLIIIKVESYRAQTGLTDTTIAKTSAMSGPTASNILSVVVRWWPPAQGMP